MWSSSADLRAQSLSCSDSAGLRAALRRALPALFAEKHIDEATGLMKVARGAREARARVQARSIARAEIGVQAAALAAPLAVELCVALAATTMAATTVAVAMDRCHASSRLR